jgi:HEAT repeat protein
VRQAVVKALLTIGGGKARAVLFHLLGDKDPEVQLSAVTAAGAFPGAGEPEARAIIERLRKSGNDAPAHEFKKEAISVLGKIGNSEAEKVLKEYMHVRWWKPKQPQEELKAAAEKALAALGRRRDHA